METTPRRWDGRTWIARATLAVVPVLALGPTGGTRTLSAALTSSAWLVLISITQRAELTYRGLLQRLLSSAVDLLALWLLAQVEPALTPVVLVLLVAAWLLHAGGLPPRFRALMLVAVVVAQATAGTVDPAIALVVGTLDLVAVVLGMLVMSERDQHRRQSTAALDRADQLTDAVLRGIGEAVVVTDATGTVTSTNEAAGLTFGHTVQGACADSLALHRGAGMLDCSRGCPLLDEDAATGQADVSRDHPNGSRQALLANVRAVRGPTGRIREVVHSFRDITALKRAEQAKTLFLATASHELKTPVAVITGYVSLLENDTLTEDDRLEAVRTIRSRTEQLSQIINRLLLASRIEGGGLTLSTGPTQLGEIVKDRVAALREVSGRDIELHLPAELPPVTAEETAVATVLDHLIENAVKYSPDGGPVTVAVDVGAHDVAVTVADRGVGMSPADAEQCFDAFWQAEADDTRRFGGSGVGLYIVRSMSRAMGGDTTVVRAVPGDGTTFRFTLRRSDAPAPPPPEASTARPDTMIDEFMRQVGVGGEG